MDDTAVTALFVQMLRTGVLDDEIVLDAAEECEAGGHALSAHRLRCLIVTASATPATDLEKQRRRASLRAIDGGNDR